MSQFRDTWEIYTHPLNVLGSTHMNLYSEVQVYTTNSISDMLLLLGDVWRHMVAAFAKHVDAKSQHKIKKTTLGAVHCAGVDLATPILQLESDWHLHRPHYTTATWSTEGSSFISISWMFYESHWLGCSCCTNRTDSHQIPLLHWWFTEPLRNSHEKLSDRLLESFNI